MLIAWILSLFHALAPHPACGDDCDRIARGIATASERDPLYKGPLGAAQTASTLTAFAWHEARLQEKVVGDGRVSFGLFQIQRETASEVLGRPVTKEELLDVDTAAPIAITLLKKSRIVCARRPEDERFAWYAAGGNGCKESGFAKSAHRALLAKRLLREHPLPKESATP